MLDPPNEMAALLEAATTDYQANADTNLTDAGPDFSGGGISFPPDADGWEDSATRLPEIYGLAGLFSHLDAEHLQAPKHVLDRFYAACDPDTAGEHLIHLARVRWETRRFDFDEDGAWAIVVPDKQGRTIVGFAAYDMNDPGLRRPYGLGTFAAGWERALFESERHPQRYLLTYFDVYAWLRGGCRGCLPFRWRRFNDALHENRVPGPCFDSDEQGRNIYEQLHAATMPEMLLEAPTP